jgi:hypothetical protein
MQLLQLTQLRDMVVQQGFITLQGLTDRLAFCWPFVEIDIIALTHPVILGLYLHAAGPTAAACMAFLGLASRGASGFSAARTLYATSFSRSLIRNQTIA